MIIGSVKILTLLLIGLKSEIMIHNFLLKYILSFLMINITALNKFKKLSLLFHFIKGQSYILTNVI